MCHICTFLFLCFDSNKVVVGSGSEGAPKYVGEGVTYGVFYGILNIFHMCMPPDMPPQVMHTLVCNTMTLCCVMTSQTNTHDIMS